MSTLSKKVIVVTGGAGLIGRAFCEAICVAGGTVVVAENNEKEGSAVANDLSNRFEGRALYLPVDVTSEKSILSLIEATINKFGYINALVNNAYPRNKNFGKNFEDVTYHDFVDNVGMHIGGYFLSSKLFANYFTGRKEGNIISMGSVYGVIAPRFDIYEGTSMTTPVEYAVLKSGIIHLTKYMSRYFKEKNIRCNSICPGGVLNGQPESFLKRYKSYTNTKGMLDAKDLTGTLVFLLSDDSAFINGQNIIVDDGFSL